jgi:hypothetical protein
MLDTPLHRFLKCVGIILILALVLLIVSLSAIFAPVVISDRVYTQYFVTMHDTFINKTGADEINRIVDESLKAETEPQRLNKIAELITHDYDDKVVGPGYPYLPNSQRYWYNDNGHIRIIPVDYNFDTQIAEVSRKLAADPNWLIYQKNGACRELSVIFYHTSKKAGFSSRIVRTGDGHDEFGKAATHWWNEIEFKGVNKTFDVQWYLQIHTNMSQGSSWSGNRSDFANNSDGFSAEQLCSWGGVWITDDQGRQIEEITNDYMGSYICTKNDEKTAITSNITRPFPSSFRIENRTLSVKVL